MTRSLGSYTLTPLFLTCALSAVGLSDGPLQLNSGSANLAANSRFGTATKLAAGIAIQNFTPSLEMQEDTDFVVTTAILVQEAISQNIVLTFPAE